MAEVVKTLPSDLARIEQQYALPAPLHHLKSHKILTDRVVGQVSLIVESAAGKEDNIRVITGYRPQRVAPDE